MCFPFGSQDTTELSCTGTETGRLLAGIGTGEYGGAGGIISQAGSVVYNK